MSPDTPAAHSEASARDPLLRSFQIKGLRLKNRVMSTSHACGLEVDGMPVAGRPQPWSAKAPSGFELYRIGDAVASRNIAAAVLDAIRLCSAL